MNCSPHFSNASRHDEVIRQSEAHGREGGMTPGTIFISHRALYASLVKELKRAIETTSRGQIRVFISEQLRGADNWREAIKWQLADVERSTRDKKSQDESIVFLGLIFQFLVHSANCRW